MIHVTGLVISINKNIRIAILIIELHGRDTGVANDGIELSIADITGGLFIG